MNPRQAALRALPSVGRMLAHPEIQPLLARHGHARVTATLRAMVDAHRQAVRRGRIPDEPVTPSGLIREAIAAIEQPASLRPVINATGILLHTGLGRAPLARQAVERIVEVAPQYASVEVDLLSGRRGDRGRPVREMLCELSGAEAALVVNNNAAATMLVLATMAQGREVVVSRGELIEIGGQFRLPDIMSASGARLREVGTTNRTRLDDFRSAVGEQTAALMAVHTSNYRIVGYTEAVPLAELVALGRCHGLPVIHDVGSGALVDFARWGVQDEPQVARSIAAGADVVLFSGDKLLGGPQCGIIVGKQEHVAAMARHPMARALRVDKLVLAALAATLELYRDSEVARREIPLLRMLETPLEALRERAAAIVLAIRNSGFGGQCEAADSVAFLGGGSSPDCELASVSVTLELPDDRAELLANRLRQGSPAVLGRLSGGRLWLDMRTVLADQDALLVQAILEAVADPAWNLHGEGDA